LISALPSMNVPCRAAGTNDILARAVVFGVVIMIIILKPKGLFSLRGR
jgi:urea transport system permease protein